MKNEIHFLEQVVKVHSRTSSAQECIDELDSLLEFLNPSQVVKDFYKYIKNLINKEEIDKKEINDFIKFYSYGLIEFIQK